MNAAIYARYSTDLQRATSIDDQVRLCRAAAARFDRAVPGDFVFIDAELSGATRHRPGYQAMLQRLPDGHFDTVFIEAVDRLSRSQAELHHALNLFRFHNVRVIEANTGIDLTDRMGKIVASVQGLISESFLDRLRDAIHRGMEGVVLRGLSAGGRCFGYRSEPIYDSAKKDHYGKPMVVGARRVVDPAEAAVVIYTCTLYAVEGLTPRAIAHRLNREGVPAMNGGSWTPSTITGSVPRALGILANPIYAGRLTWNRTRKVRDPVTGRRIIRLRPPEEWQWADVPELRIVPQELWDRVQARRQLRRFTANGQTGGIRPKFLLSGLLECAECGSHYIIQCHRAGSRHYGCARHYDRGPAVCRNNKLVRQQVVEQKVLDHIFGDLFAPHRLAYLTRAVNTALQDGARSASGIVAQREAALRDARTTLRNIMDAIAEGIRTPSTKAMLEEAERRVVTCEAAVREAKQRPAPVVVVKSAIEGYLKDLRGTLERDVDEARRLLSRGFDRIVLRRDEDGRLWAEVRGNVAGLLNLEGADRLLEMVPEEGLEPPRA